MIAKYRFNKIVEPRNGYYVSYTPPSTARLSAILVIVFSDNTPEEVTVRNIMEQELESWIKRYPVPLMVYSFDIDDNRLVSGDIYEMTLVGWIDRDSNAIVTSWKGNDLNEAMKKFPINKELPEIYADIPYKTEKEVKEENLTARKNSIIGSRVLKVVLSLWLAAIPAGWAIYQAFGPEWIGWIALGYVLWQALGVAGRIWGIKKPTENETEQAEIKRKKEHYYYHCELNPQGFIRLRSENFSENIRKSNREDFDKIMSERAE